MKFLNRIILAGAISLLGAASLSAATPPQAVKKTSTVNRIYTRHAGQIPSDNYSKLLRAPQARYISVADAQTDPKLPTIIGGMLDSGTWEWGNTAPGLYSFPAREGEPFTFIRSDIYPNGGGVEADGTYFACEVEESGEGVSIIIRAYDTETWRNTRSFSPGDYSFIATDVAHDPVTGQIYGCLWDTSGSGYMFGTIDYINGITRKIKTLDNMWNAVAIDADGTIYAIDQEMVETGATVQCVKSSLYKVNRETGAMTLIGDTGLLPYYASSAVIDHRTGRMFWSVTPKDDSQSALYEVNKATGACTLIYRYPAAEQFMGMYVPAPLADDAAPAAVTNLAANFPGGSLSGTIDFTVPTLTYGGAQGTGAISYNIFVGSTSVASGTTQWGKAESVPVSLNAGGEIEFTVVLTNAAGASPKEKVKAFIGTDVPVAPEVSAAYSDGIMTVTWTVPQKSVNGGYIDPAAITYKVTRMPDGTVVAGAAKTTTFTESLPEPSQVTTYYYTVEAVYDRKTSAPGVSNRIVLGAAQAPYTIDFSQVSNLNDVTIINDNPASEEFELSNGALLLSDDRLFPKDDWVITAPVRLIPGTVYAVTVEASSQGSRYAENIEVFCGDANTAEAMTEEIIPVTTVATLTAQAFESFTGYIAPEQERTVFVGVHACSPADVWNLRIKSISITPAFDTTAPGAVTDFTVTPEPMGELSVEISLNAPTTDYDGNPISEISHLCIYRDGVAINTVENPAVGAAITYTDKAVTAGEHTYSAIAFQGNNRGREVKVKVFVGVAVPSAPQAVAIAETENFGEVTLSWTPVTTDANGYPISEALLSYNVYAPNAAGTSWVPVQTGIKGTSCTLQAVSGDEQIFALYAVAAATTGGTSQATVSDAIAVGKPYSLPYLENFANGTLSSLFTYDGIGGDWEIVVNNPQFLAQADDNGFAQMFGEYYGSSAQLISGKIDLAGAVNPVLSFQTFNYYTAATGPDYNAIDVYACPLGGDWTKLKEVIVKDAAEQNRWGAVTVDLSAYAGKTVQLMFHATNYSYDTTTLDRIRVANGVAHNLSVVSITAPASAAAGEKFRVGVKVENVGLNDAEEYTVQLFRDGEQAEARIMPALAAGRNIDIEFEQVFTPLVEDDVEYHAAIVYNPDMVADDNTSATVTVAPVLNALPVVPELRATLADGAAVLDWDEPDTDNAAPDPIVENFDTAESYATTGQCGWTFIDADGAPTQDAAVVIGVVNFDDMTKYLTMPGIGDRSPLAWAVIDHTTGFGTVSRFEPHNGDKLLISLAADGCASDDWAISPRLFGGEQTISFWAKGKEDDPEWGTETFEILYSTTGTAIADFTLISKHSICSLDWTQFSAKLPEGATHFAVRATSNDAYALMIDDFTFIPEGATADITLAGYNVYRDGACINADPVEDNTYTDADAANGEHTYIVTALYDKGESRGSNAVTVETSGIDTVGASAATITVEGRTITVIGAEGRHITVAATDGRLLASEAASARFTCTVSTAGVYVLTIDGRATKLIVR